jgi:threonine/homoserine/homoserine lactone efflux protein
MDLHFLAKGLAIGFSIAAPVGPIGVLCIRRSLAEGPGVGLATGLGAATADALYACVAAFGLTAVSSFLIQWQFWLGLIGGLFLFYLGIRTFVSAPVEAVQAREKSGLLSAYLSTVFLTLTNPATLFSFLAVFAGLGLGAIASYSAAGFMVLGVFSGSALWWLLLSNGVGLFRGRLNPSSMRIVNRVSGITLFAFGLYAFSRL